MLGLGAIYSCTNKIKLHLYIFVDRKNKQTKNITRESDQEDCSPAGTRRPPAAGQTQIHQSDGPHQLLALSPRPETGSEKFGHGSGFALAAWRVGGARGWDAEGWVGSKK